MPLRFFAIPAPDPREAEAELNALLRSRRVVSMERRFSEGPHGSLWFLAVEPLTVSKGPRTSHPPPIRPPRHRPSCRLEFPLPFFAPGFSG